MQENIPVGAEIVRILINHGWADHAISQYVVRA